MPVRARLLFVLPLAAACASRAPAPPPPPALEPPPPAAEAPAPSAPRQVDPVRRAEEDLERVVVAEPTAAARDDTVVELYFESGGADLVTAARRALDGMVEGLLADAKDYYVEVQGHTDASGIEAANLRLAERRAEVVRAYLHRKKGVPLDRMGVVPLGSAAPVADNDTAEGRGLNRRVVVVVVRAPPPPG